MRRFIYLALFLVTAISVAQPTVPPVSTMRSTAYYLYRPDPVTTSAVPVSPEEMLANEAIDFPQVASYGFNTILLVEFRTKFDPNLDNNYDLAGLQNFRMELETARQSGLRVMIGLNYGDGVLVEKPGSTAAVYVQPIRIRSWVAFVTWLLTNIDDYRDMVYPVAFEEGHIGPTWGSGWNSPNANAVADVERQSLGNLPALLDPALRSRWSLGWYGAVTGYYAKPGHPSAQGFDWYAQGVYYFDNSITLSWLPASSKGWTDDEIRANWTNMFNRMNALYPGQTIVQFEGGYYTCSSATFDRQAQVYALLAKVNMERGQGFNLWGFRTLVTPEQECQIRHGKGGHAMVNPDGTPRPAVLAVQALLQGDTQPPTTTRIVVVPLPREPMQPIDVVRGRR